MGSMIFLSVGNMEIDWGKNHGFVHHGALFQVSDVKKIPYLYAGDEKASNGKEDPSWEIITEYKDGLSKPINEVVDRLHLLGYTFNYCLAEFNYLLDQYEHEINNIDNLFDHFRAALVNVDVSSLSQDYGEPHDGYGKFFRREIFPRLNFPTILLGNSFEYNAAGFMEDISPYVILKLLSENKSAQNLPVNWAFSDLIEGGWGEREDFVKKLDNDKRFLIVTEGSSDSKIIKHAIHLLRPHIADFFDFVDMEKGYPFTGAGNLVNFVKGLISISVQNNVIVVFDNDVEGIEKFNICCSLKLPDNIKTIKLPDQHEFIYFPTVGPNGSHPSNINGKGAAIECYLDLDEHACVRWNNYNDKAKDYHGVLIDKDKYKKIFLDQRKKVDTYNYSKIESLIDKIIHNCVQISEQVNILELNEI